MQDLVKFLSETAPPVIYLVGIVILAKAYQGMQKEHAAFTERILQRLIDTLKEVVGDKD